MNKRQEKKQCVRCLSYKNVPRKRIIQRLKKTAFAGYSYIGITVIRLSKHPCQYKGIKKAFKYKTHNNLDILFKYAEDMCNYDFDWLDYISFS